jgi:hypothetical protein
MGQLYAGTSDKAWGYWYFDDPRDYTAIQVSMDLFDFFGYNITEDHLRVAIAPRKKLLNLANALVPPSLEDLNR